MTTRARGARSPHRVHQARLAFLLELLPQVADVDRDHVVVVRLVAPHRREQLLARKHLPRMAEQVLEQVELSGREAELSRPAPRRVRGRLELDISEPQPVGRTRTPQQRAHAREQLLVGEGFHEVVVGAAVEAPHAMLGAAERGEHQDRKLGGLAHPAADRDAVRAREHQVEHHQIGHSSAGATHRVNPVAGHLDLMAFRHQHSLQRGGQWSIVLDHQDPRTCHR